MTYFMGDPASGASPAPAAAAGTATSSWRTKGLILLNRLLRTKDPTNLSSPDDVSSARTTLTRCLDTLDLTSLGVGSCVGTGMYLVAGMVARKIAGPGVILSFIIAAVASIFSGACYAEFGVRVPHTTGSAYMYSYVTVGEFVAFVIGWNMVLEYLIGTSACACALSACFNILTDGAVESATTELFGTGPFGSPPDILAFFITILMTGLLVTGAKKSLMFTNIMNLINFGVWAFIMGASLFYLDTSNWTRHGGFLPYGWSGVLTGAATCFYAFIGFDIIATAGEETINPKKSIPKAIVGSLLIALVAYVSSSLVITLMVPYNEVDENSGLLEAFGHVGASRCRSIVGIGALAGLTVAMFGSMFPMPRVVYAMAKDGLIFRTLASVWDRTNTPAFATVTFGLAAAFAALLISLDVLVEMMSIGTLLAYTLVSTCVLILRYQPKSTTLVELIPESIRTPAMLTPAATPRGSTGDIRQLQNQQNSIINNAHVSGGGLSPSDCYATGNRTDAVNEVVPGLSRFTSALQNASFPSMKLSIPTNPFLASNSQQQQQQASPATTLEVGLSGNVVVTKKVTKGSMFPQCSFDSDTTVGTTEDREEPMTDTDTSADSSWPNKTTVRTTSTNPFLSGPVSSSAPRQQRLTSPLAFNRSANISESNSYDQIDQAATLANSKKPDGFFPGEAVQSNPHHHASQHKQRDPTSRGPCWYPVAFEYIFPQIFPWHIEGPATEETGHMVMRGVGVFLVFIILANVTLVTGIERIEQGSAPVTLLMLICFGASFISVLFIARHPENRRALPFLTPGLPYIPAVAITVNIYLIFKLSILTLVRFVVWMTIGLLIYFMYGIKNSSAEDDWVTEQIELRIKEIVRDEDITPASSVATTEEKFISCHLRPNKK